MSIPGDPRPRHERRAAHKAFRQQLTLARLEHRTWLGWQARKAARTAKLAKAA